MNPPSGPTREAYKHSMEEWRQQALAQRDQYQPRVQDQINRLFHEYSPPFYASLIGYKRDWNLLVATSRASGFASTLGRELEDQEVKAIAEYTLNNIHNNAAAKYITVGLAAYMTYRGRHTWQFPFYKPKLGGRFNPNEATSIFTNKKIRGRYPRFTWHTLRFTAYAAVTMLMVEPVFRTVNFIRVESAMAQDSRLEQFTKDASKRVEQVMANPTSARVPFKNNTPKEEGSWGNEDTDRSDQPRYNIPWNRTQVPAQQTQQTQESQSDDHDWDVLDDDDASPVASSARNQPVSSVSGSAWDRIRQQSQQPQTQQEPRGWAPKSEPQSWGSSTNSSDSYSFSSSDEEKPLAKEQAQQEFDKLVERERRGVDEDKWGRR
ncbi:hypothetical protein FSOLCH5_005460 [Fusarium solani]|jgi:hypothetical protein|uniref:Uncharacterized protein n=1 Tax=Fusarium solani TaxID=169388 RepID=A0A9P9L6L8_FUSSL|nr:uncharacterized protein B0J15DRAFT_519407 [Fusarium solani]KAH7275820.1 hypothetical protein B0J15DRAFT_519407 [Fusarium solani]KAJ3465326.1 hypothetical protein MRS44_005984 [Fusarium solani]KAJ4227132.1 hypothetical protein NW759_004500 [Fusarium solani]